MTKKIIRTENSDTVGLQENLPLKEKNQETSKEIVNELTNGKLKGPQETEENREENMKTIFEVVTQHRTAPGIGMKASAHAEKQYEYDPNTGNVKYLTTIQKGTSATGHSTSTFNKHLAKDRINNVEQINLLPHSHHLLAKWIARHMATFDFLNVEVVYKGEKHFYKVTQIDKNTLHKEFSTHAEFSTHDSNLSPDKIVTEEQILNFNDSSDRTLRYEQEGGFRMVTESSYPGASLALHAIRENKYLDPKEKEYREVENVKGNNILVLESN